MSTKYVIHRWKARIDGYECVKETEKFAWLKGFHGSAYAAVVSQKRKGSDVFDTWAEAHAELTLRAEDDLNAARKRLEMAQGFADNVRSMKPPADAGEATDG